jgi:sphingolipid 4-desaturase/C4-monooxygenase
MRADFIHDNAEEPHRSRRKAMLEKYPQLRELYGTDLRLPIGVAVLFALQMTIAFLLRDAAIGRVFFWAYVVGGVANHALSLANHEISHFLAFKKPFFNTLLGFCGNLVQGFPSFA